MNQKEMLYLGGGIVVGFAIGALAMRSTFKHAYERIAQEEIDSVKEHYKILRKEDMDTPAEAAKALSRDYSKTLDNLGYAGDEEEETTSQKSPKVENIFINDSPSIPLPPREGKDPDQELDLSDDDEWAWLTKDRDPSRPYIISVDEYMLENDHFDKETLTYYEEDDTLCDLSDRPIDDPDSLVGNDPLLRFGKASGDRNIVYVRNERISVDYEILRDTRSYTEIVLGIKDEDSGPRKFREDD